MSPEIYREGKGRRYVDGSSIVFIPYFIDFDHLTCAAQHEALTDTTGLVTLFIKSTIGSVITLY